MVDDVTTADTAKRSLARTVVERLAASSSRSTSALRKLFAVVAERERYGDRGADAFERGQPCVPPSADPDLQAAWRCGWIMARDLADGRP